MKINVDGVNIEYQVKGAPYTSDETTLLYNDDDLTLHKSWHKDGYTVQPLFDKSIYNKFVDKVETILIEKFKESNLSIPSPFRLQDYHLLSDTYADHLSVVNKTKLIEESEMSFFFKALEKRISEILNIDVESTKPYNDERVFHFRVIRPNESDFNPLHKDVWQDENKNAINIYIPIVGSTTNSSLILGKGSHLISEHHFVRTNEGAQMNDIQFNVPGLIESKTDLNFERVTPQLNEVLVFSPYLIHGGSANFNANETRISLEMRFWRKT